MDKKVIFSLSALAVLGVAAGAFAGIKGSSTALTRAEGTSSTEATVYDFEGDNPFEGWSCSDESVTLSSFLTDSSGTFWDTTHKFYGNGSKFFREYNQLNTWTGTVASPYFTLGGEGYISALIGGGKDSTKAYIDIQDEAGNSVGHLTNAGFADPERSEDLTFNFIQISEQVGNKVRIVITQNVGNDGLAGINVDDIAAGLTKDELLTRFSAEKEKVKDADEADISGQGLKELYENVLDGVLNTDDHNVMNAGFETGTSYGWTALSNTPNMMSAVSSISSYWAEQVTFNKKGDYFWNGFNNLNHYDGESRDPATTFTGLDENATYSIRSSDFTLGGKGYVSFAIGGNSSAVEIRRSSDDKTIARFGNGYNVGTFPYVADNLGESRQGTMVHFYADLSGYIGDKLYFVFMDTDSGDGWKLLFFDDVVTYYDAVPTGIVDNVTNSPDTRNADYAGKEGTIAWKEASNTNAIGEEANTFLKYFKSLRDETGSICSVKNTQTKYEELEGKYNALSSNEVKEIVLNSHDSGLAVEGKSDKFEGTVRDTLAMLGIGASSSNAKLANLKNGGGHFFRLRHPSGLLLRLIKRLRNGRFHQVCC
jgi:hypothetical protein